MSSVTAGCRRWANPLRAMTAIGLVASLLTHHGSSAHALIGLVFVLTALGHVLAHSRWIRTVTSRIGRGLPRKIAVDAAIDAVLVVLVVFVGATGVAALLDSSDTADVGGAGELHGPLAVLLVLAGVAHVVRHRRRYTRRNTGGKRPVRTVPGEKP